MEAVAADAPLLAPAPRQRVGGGLRGDRGVEARVEHRDLRDVREARARAASIARSAGALWSGASDSSAKISRPHLVVDQRPARGTSARRARRGARPPRPGRPRAASESSGSAVPSSPTRWSLRLVEPALTTRTFSQGHVQSRISGWSSPCSRVVGARAQARVDHLLAQVRARARRGRARGRSRRSRGGSGRGRSASPCRTASSSCPPPCSRARAGCRGSCAGR